MYQCIQEIAQNYSILAGSASECQYHLILLSWIRQAPYGPAFFELGKLDRGSIEKERGGQEASVCNSVIYCLYHFQEYDTMWVWWGCIMNAALYQEVEYG